MADPIIDSLVQEYLKVATDLARELEAIDWDAFGTTRFKEAHKLTGVTDVAVKPLARRYLDVFASLNSDYPESQIVLFERFSGIAGRLRSNILAYYQDHFTRDQNNNPVNPFDVSKNIMHAAADLDVEITAIEARLLIQNSTNFLDRLNVGLTMCGQVSEAHEDAKRLLLSADAVLKTARDAAAKVGLTLDASAMGKSKTSHGRFATAWLIASVGLGITLVRMTHNSIATKVAPPLPTDSWLAAANLGFFGPRVLMLSVISYALVAAVRSYRAERHNQISNAQKVDALATFDAFKAAASEKLEDAVLLQASEAVFAPQPTGFTDKDVGGATHVAELLKVLKG